MKKTANPKSKWHCVDLDWAYNKETPGPIEKIEEPTMLACYKAGYTAAQNGSPITSVPKLRVRLEEQWKLGWRSAGKNRKKVRKKQSSL